MAENDHTDYVAEDPFADEEPVVRELLDRLHEAQADNDLPAMLDLTAELLALPSLRSLDIVHLLRGDAMFEQNYYRPAAEQYRQAIAHGADDFSIAWFKLGNAFAADKQYEPAALALSRAAELEPGHPAVWLQLGYALLELHDWAGAEPAFRNAVALTAGLQGHYGLAWLIYSRGRASEESKHNSFGLGELRQAIAAGEVGPEVAQLGAVQAMLTDAVEPDFPFWHCWVNPAFELARGTDLHQPPLDTVWADLVQWPRNADGSFRVLRDVLIDLPEWG